MLREMCSVLHERSGVESFDLNITRFYDVKTDSTNTDAEDKTEADGRRYIVIC